MTRPRVSAGRNASGLAGPPAEIDEFLARATRWANERADIRALALVGSHARGAATSESDVDLILLTDDAATYLERDEWVADLGARAVTRPEAWGAVTVRWLSLARGPDVEIGVGAPSWAQVDPIDTGTLGVVRNGMRALYDPDGVLDHLARVAGDGAASAGYHDSP